MHQKDTYAPELDVILFGFSFRVPSMAAGHQNRKTAETKAKPEDLSVELPQGEAGELLVRGPWIIQARRVESLGERKSVDAGFDQLYPPVCVLNPDA